MIINKLDNVEVNIKDGHKYALQDIQPGEMIMKYGCPIGHATQAIQKGEHVHTHNVKTNLSGKIAYHYQYKDYGLKHRTSDKSFLGYRVRTARSESVTKFGL